MFGAKERYVLSEIADGAGCYFDLTDSVQDLETQHQ